MNRKNQELHDFIRQKYHEYRQADKYLGDKKFHQVSVFSTGDNGSSIDDELEQFISEKRDVKAFTYYKPLGRLSWLDTKDIHAQFKRV